MNYLSSSPQVYSDDSVLYSSIAKRKTYKELSSDLLIRSGSRIKSLALTVLLVVLVGLCGWGQAVGDYRSATTGNWTALATWERYNGTTWATPSGTSPQGYPGQYSGTGAVTIRSGHVVTIGNTGITTQAMGTLFIQNTGQLYLTGSNSTVIFSLSTSVIDIISGGSIYFSNKARLVLNTNAVVTLAIGPGSLLGSCNNNDEVWIGTTIFAACAGAPGNIFTFTQLMNMGGTLNAIATSNSPICQGSTINLTGNYSGAVGTAPTYSWSVTAPGGGISTYATQNASIPSAIAGTYSATLTVSTILSGTTYTNSETIAVVVNPLPTLTGASQATTVCDGSPATINLTGLVPNTTFSLNYTINGASQTTKTGLVASGTGTSSFLTSNLAAGNNGQTLQITGITITSSPTNCSQIFAQNVTLSVWTTGPGTWTGATSSDWNTASNWCGGAVPSSTTDVTIQPSSTSVPNQPVIGSSGGSCHNINIIAGASLAISGAYTLSVYGNWSNNGTFTPNTSTVSFQGTTAAQAIGGTGTNTFNNLTINNTFTGGGVNAASDITVNGILNLAATNPSTIRGSLEMVTNYNDYPGTTNVNPGVNNLVSYTLYMGVTATTVGQGDVTGIIKRTTIAATTAYSFGNQYTTIAISAGGTLPTAMQVTVKIGTAPPGKTNSISRHYEIVPTGGSSCYLDANFHYLDAELNSNTEANLVTWDYDIGGGNSTPDEHGRSAYDFTNNFIGMSNIPIDYFIYVPVSHAWRTVFEIADYTPNQYKTWNGSLSSNWNTSDNWTPDGVPNQTAFIIIPDANNTNFDPILLTSDNPTINTLTIQAGGIINMTSNPNVTVTIQNTLSGGWEDQSGLSAPGGTVIFANPGATISGVPRFNNLMVNLSADVTVQTGTNMKIAGTLTRNGTGKWYADIYENTVEYNGADQTVVLPDDSKYHNLVLSGNGLKTIASGISMIHGNLELSGTASAAPGYGLTIAGNLSLGSGTSFTAGAYIHNLGGNFVNNGGTFTNTGSTFNLNGTSAQSIGGSASTTFNNLTFNNAQGVSLGVNVTIDGTLNFINGLITTGSHTLTVGSAGNITGASTSNYVNGILARIYSSAASKEFPIGKGGNYRPLTLEYTALTGTSTTTVEQFESIIPGTIPDNITSQSRYWTVSQTGGSAFTYSITLNGSPFEPGTSPVILKGNGDNNSSLTASYFAPNFMVTGQTSFSNFAVGSNCAAPSISGQPANASACVEAGTAQFTVTATASGGTLSYQWQESSTGINGTYLDISNGGIYSNATTATLSLTNPPSGMNGYYYRVVLTLSCGSSVTSNAAMLTVNSLPQGSISANGPFCGSGAGQLTWTASSGTGPYTVIYNDGSTNHTKTGAISGTAFDVATNPVNASTIYTLVSVTDNNGVGCTRSSGFTGSSAEISVNPLPDGSISGDSICEGGTGHLIFSASSGTGPFTLVINGTTYSSINSNIPFSANPNPSATTAYTLTSINGAHGCERTSGISGPAGTIVVNPPRSISGSFTYYNLANTPLTSGITVELWQGGSQLGTDYTVTGGTYSFTGLCPGTYEIRAFSDNSTVGAVNTTDAGQTNYWPIALYAIEKVRFLAGDVSSNFFINGSDAQAIQRNFVDGTPFTGEPWVFWKTGDTPVTINSMSSSYPTLTLGFLDATVNMYGLCKGDFNRSFNPALKNSASTSLDLVFTETRQVGANQEFDLPLSILKSSGVGAISLILNFPAELVEVQDVVMNNSGGMLDWAVYGDELRIGWNSMNPLSLDAGAELLSLKLKTTSAFTKGNSIRLALAQDPLNEMADETFEVIPDAVLGIDVIEASTTGIPNSEPEIWNFTCYPNPFYAYTNISYTLPFDGKVTLEICNVFGGKVATLLSETQTRGDHMVKFDAIGLPNGVFTATLRVKSPGDEVVKTIKLINNK